MLNPSHYRAISVVDNPLSNVNIVMSISVNNPWHNVNIVTARCSSYCRDWQQRPLHCLPLSPFNPSFGCRSQKERQQRQRLLLYVRISGDRERQSIGRLEICHTEFRVLESSRRSGQGRDQLKRGSWSSTDTIIVYICLLYTSPSPRDS